MDPEQEAIAKKAVKALRSRIDLIQKHLEPVLAGPLSETYGKLPVNEKAQFQVLLSYTLNTLYYIYLRTQGTNPLDHEVTSELQRVKQYIEKIKKAEGRGPKPSMQLDKGAAGRFIKSALAGDEEPAKEGETGKKRTLRKEKTNDPEEEGEVQEEGAKRKRSRMDPFVGPKNGSN